MRDLMNPTLDSVISQILTTRFREENVVFREYISHYSNINVLLLVVSVEINFYRQITVSALR